MDHPVECVRHHQECPCGEMLSLPYVTAVTTLLAKQLGRIFLKCFRKHCLFYSVEMLEGSVTESVLGMYEALSKRNR